jgi:glycosyltransferase involved in cell wall biosynthesis
MVTAFIPKVTAVIPTRNRPDLVKRAVCSALNQTVQDVEVIVVVDGPDPATSEALRTITDPRLRVIHLEYNVGGSEARNIGARVARGAWVALLDDDDEWIAEKTERQLAMVGSATEDLVFCVSPIIWRWPDKKDRVYPRRLPLPDEPLADYMFAYSCGFQSSTYFISKDLFSLIPFQNGLKRLQDTDWFLRAVSHPDVHLRIVPEPLAVVHKHEEGTSASIDWEFGLRWAAKHRTLIPPRAYARFVIQDCLTRAVKQRLGGQVAFRLLRECVCVGRATPLTLVVFALVYLASPRTRRKLRDLFLSREPRTI